MKIIFINKADNTEVNFYCLYIGPDGAVYKFTDTSEDCYHSRDEMIEQPDIAWRVEASNRNY